MFERLKWSRPDGTFIGLLADGREWHLTPSEPWWQEALDTAQLNMPPSEPTPEPEILTAEQLIEQIRATVQAHVDATARERLYDNGNSLASYVASTNPQWTAEAQAFVAWRDAVWAQVYGLWAEPPEPWPTPAAVIADLPAINWPA